MRESCWAFRERLFFARLRLRRFFRLWAKYRAGPPGDRCRLAWRMAGRGGFD